MRTSGLLHVLLGAVYMSRSRLATAFVHWHGGRGGAAALVLRHGTTETCSPMTPARRMGSRRRPRPLEAKRDHGLFEFNEEVVLRVGNLTNLGEGVARIDLEASLAALTQEERANETVVGRLEEQARLVVMVPGVVPGERVRGRVFNNRKTHSLADLVEVLEPSPWRVEPSCKHVSEGCGGCQYQHVSIDYQRTWKRQHVADVLERIGDVASPEVNPVIGSDEVLGYRSKLTPHRDAPGADGKVGPIGFMRRGTGDKLVDIPRCAIATDAINSKLSELREEVRVRAQLEAEQERLYGGAEAAAAAQMKGAKGKRAKRGGKKGAAGGGKKGGAGGGKRGGQGETLLLRDARDGVATDPNSEVHEEMMGLTFKFRAGEFFQNNPFVIPKMVEYTVAQACADTTDGRKLKYLIDAYCGGGLFCLSAARHFKSCAGIEISELNIKSAQLNAELNGITNCNFVAGTAENIFKSVNGFDPASTALVVDPPRKGCSEEFLAQLFAFRPRRVVYVSCDPATQARDTKAILETGAYQMGAVQPFDLFPQTRHIENVITFDLLGP